MKRNSLAAEEETLTCVSCAAQNRLADTFCHQCGAPISTTATLDPLNTIRINGFLLNKALEGRPKLIVLLGIWILHLPVLVIGIGGAIYYVLNRKRFSDVLFFWALLGLAYVAFVILYRVTKNYLTIPKKI